MRKGKKNRAGLERWLSSEGHMLLFWRAEVASSTCVGQFPPPATLSLGESEAPSLCRPFAHTHIPTHKHTHIYTSLKITLEEGKKVQGWKEAPRMQMVTSSLQPRPGPHAEFSRCRGDAVLQPATQTPTALHPPHPTHPAHPQADES